MRANQNQLERFRSIAKRIVDDHCAEMFTGSGATSGYRQQLAEDVYYSHLDVLGKELNEQAASFIGSYKMVNEKLKTEIWNMCQRYVEHFTKWNQPSAY